MAQTKINNLVEKVKTLCKPSKEIIYDVKHEYRDLLETFPNGNREYLKRMAIHKIEMKYEQPITWDIKPRGDADGSNK